MDPNRLLKDIRWQCEKHEQDEADCCEMVEAFLHLDRELSKGGALPADWSKVRVGPFPGRSQGRRRSRRMSEPREIRTAEDADSIREDISRAYSTGGFPKVRSIGMTS